MHPESAGNEPRRGGRPPRPRGRGRGRRGAPPPPAGAGPRHAVGRPLLLILLIPLIPLILVVACDAGGAGDGAGAAAPIRVRDGVGRTVTVRGPARRVVSMMPALTEWLVAMGLGDRLVARTDYDDDPALARLPSVGGGLDPSVEWLAARRPDLVLAWPDAPSRSLVSRLEALDIPVYTAPVQTIDQAFRTARDLGRLLGDTAAAAAAIREVRAGLDSVRNAVAGRHRPAVLFLIGLDPVMAAGPGTFLDELVTRAGGRSAIADVGILWPQLSIEDVVRRAPDVIIVGSAGVPHPAAALAGRPGWRDVPAVRTGRVFAVDPDAVNRPGPGLDEAAALLAARIHGPAAPEGRP